MVYAYLCHLPKPTRGQRRTIFLEPRLESGCPDLVAVFWRSAPTRRWNRDRVGITARHAQILQFLHTSGPVSEVDLRATFGARAERLIEELVIGGLVLRRSRGKLTLLPIRQVFALERIVAVEAKIGSRLAALQQASQNQWFASESYVLLRSLRRDQYFVDECRSLGIGVLTADTGFSDAPVPAVPGKLPRSYVSWLFNEWCWRTYQELGDGTEADEQG